MTRRRPTLLLVTFAALLAVAAPADGAKTPRVYAQVVGQTELVAGWRITTPTAFSARVARRSCPIPAATPLAALEQVRRQTGPQFTLAGSCTTPTVAKIGDERGTSKSPWSYKVGRRLGAASATQRLKANDQVLWFRCARTRSGCRRTLEIAPALTRATAGERITVTVRGYDDNGRGIRVENATVSLSGGDVRTDAKGRARLIVPSPAGPYPIYATAKGMADAFPARVVAG